MNVLRLEIGEAWPENTAVSWVLLDGAGQRTTQVAQGAGRLEEAPPAAACEAVLTGAQCALYRLRLPPGTRADRAQWVAYALEEQLAEETETQHCTVVGQDGDQAVVAVVAAARLRAVITAVAAAGHPLRAVWPVLAWLPVAPDQWTVAVDGGGGLLRQSDGSGFAWDWDDATATPPWLLRQAVAEARHGAQAPAAIQILVAAGGAQPALAEWSRILGLPLRPGPPWSALPGPVSVPSRANLLHGPFAPRRASRGGFARLKPALAVAAAALVLHVGIGVGHAHWLEHGAQDLRQQQATLFTTAFPGAAVVDPALQTRRLLNDIKPKHGLLRDDDCLALLGDLADVLGASARGALQSLRYEGEVLKVDLTLRAPMDATALIDGLATRGIAAVAAGPGGSNGQVALTLQRRMP